MAKKAKKILRDERAVTPVLSNLLLTVVAVVAMALATTTTYLITTNLRETMSERLITEDLWFNNSTSTINIYLRNVGKVAIDVSSIYVNNTAQPFTRPMGLEVGEHKSLNFSRNWISSGLYYVDVVTTRGTHVGGYYKAP